MPVVSEAHRENRRQQILTAFAACVAREGFHRTTMAEVIAESGLSAGAVYGYFKSKTALIRAIAERNLGLAAERLAELAESDGVMSPALILDAYIGTPEEDYGEETAKISVQVWAEATRDPEVAAMASQRFDRLRKLLSSLIRRCQRDGTLAKSGHPDDMALVLLGLLPSYLLHSCLLPDVTPKAYLRGALDVFAAGTPRASTTRAKARSKRR